jgi:hypothetical protein
MVERSLPRYIRCTFPAAVSMSYPKDMYVKVCGTRERASIRVLGYMYIVYIREYIYDGNVLVSVLFSREDVHIGLMVEDVGSREGSG